MNQNEIRLAIHCDEEINPSFVDTEASRLSLKTDKIDIGELGIDPIAVTMIIGGTYAVTHLIISVIEKWRGGTMLDLSVKPISIRRVRSLAAGVFIIIGSDSEVEIKVKDLPKDGLERVVEKLLSLGEVATKETIKHILKSIGKAEI